MIVLKILKILFFSLLGALGLVLLLLCLPVTVLIRYDSAGGAFELTVKYLFIPFRLLPKDGRSVLYRLERFSARRREKKKLFRTRLRNFMLKRRLTRSVYRGLAGLRRRRRLKKLEKKKKKLAAKKKQGNNASGQKKKGTFGRLLEERGITGMISWISRIARIAGGMLRKTFRGIIIRKLDLLIDAGGEDASQAAINCGRLCAALLPAVSVILSAVRRYRRNICVRPDYNDPRVKASLDAELVIFPIAVAGHALMALLKMLIGEIRRQVRERMDRAAADNSRRAAAQSK